MTINIKITQDDIKNKITLREMLAAQNGSIESSIGILSRFIIDETGTMLTAEVGKELLLDLTITELEEIVKVFSSTIAEAAIPNVNAAS